VCKLLLFSSVVFGCSLLYCGSSSCSVKTAHRLLRTCDPSFQEQVCAGCFVELSTFCGGSCSSQLQRQAQCTDSTQAAAEVRPQLLGSRNHAPLRTAVDSGSSSSLCNSR
jgi:hypothetical protein